jgi:AcrR family transcriptional regulator
MATVARQRTREDPIVRRRQIVDVAMRVIGRQGFNGFTVQVLAAECGLSNAGLLYYFGSKDALLIALLDEVERQDAQVIAPLVAEVRGMPVLNDGSAKVRIALLRTIVERFAERRELGRFTLTLQTESLDPAHPAHGWFQLRSDAALRLFESMVTGLVAQPDLTARLLFGLMNGLGEQWLRADRGFDLLAAWDEGVARLVPLKGIKA